MKHFFSIKLWHEYNNGLAISLTIVPATTNEKLVLNNRLLFREDPGSITCFIEDDEALKNAIEVIYFWVVCIDESFYSYTEYPTDINFSKPYYYWKNQDDSTILQQSDQCDLHPGKPPKHAIGCIGLSIKSLNEINDFKINFKVKKTIWEYRVIVPKSQNSYIYNIEDETTENTNEKNIFEIIETNEDNLKIFRSQEPVPYLSKGSKRFKLKWKLPEGAIFPEEHEMTLPLANYAYKMVNKDNIELTPVYIHI